MIGEVPFEQLRDATSELNNIDAAHHFALGVGEHLAVLGGDHRGEFVAVLVEQTEELVHDARAADRRRVGPAVEGLLRDDDRGVHVGGRAQVQLARHRAGGRVVDGLRARLGMDDAFAPDEMTDRRGGVEGGGGHAVSWR